jgi:transposase
VQSRQLRFGHPSIQTVITARLSFPPSAGRLTYRWASATGKGFVMHAPSPEFRQRAVALTREGAIPVATNAKDPDISVSSPRNWMAQADADDNGGQEWPLPRRGNRLSCANGIACWNEILRRAAAYFARENVVPK